MPILSSCLKSDKSLEPSAEDDNNVKTQIDVDFYLYLVVKDHLTFVNHIHVTEPKR